MKVYVLIRKAFDPTVMEHSDQAVKEIVDIYKNFEDAESRRQILEHEEELLGLMYPEDESLIVYYILEHELR